MKGELVITEEELKHLSPAARLVWEHWIKEKKALLTPGGRRKECLLTP